MTQQPTVATHKIILFVVFVSVALITSLFVFHLSHQTTQTVTAEQGMTFPAARDISPFELVSSDGKPFTEKNLLNHWTLLFFGFTHCASICPTTLAMLDKVYSQLHAEIPTLQVVLISLDPKRDSTETLARYTASFNKDFIGVSGKIQNLRKLQSQLGVFSSQDTSTATGDNYQIQHTPSVMLINPKGKWVGIFNNTMTPQQFAHAIRTSVSNLPR